MAKCAQSRGACPRVAPGPCPVTAGNRRGTARAGFIL